jgi:hypothetical protein
MDQGVVNKETATALINCQAPTQSRLSQGALSIVLGTMESWVGALHLMRRDGYNTALTFTLPSSFVMVLSQTREVGIMGVNAF